MLHRNLYYFEWKRKVITAENVLMSEPEPLLTKRQLAEFFQVTPKTIERRVVEGMPGILFGGQWRFRLSQVEAWTKAQAEATGAATGTEG